MSDAKKALREAYRNAPKFLLPTDLAIHREPGLKRTLNLLRIRYIFHKDAQDKRLYFLRGTQDALIRFYSERFGVTPDTLLRPEV